MLNPNFVFLGLCFNIIGGISYFVDTIKGKTKPNKVTWFLWALAPLIAFFAELKQGIGVTALLTFIVGFNPLMIFIASFVNKKSQWKISRLDIVCGFLSLVGLLLWYLTKSGNIAILFSILSDALAGVPTMIKAWHFPETENYLAFLCGAISAGITLLTIKQWNIAYYGFPLYIFISTIIMVLLIKGKLRKVIS